MAPKPPLKELKSILMVFLGVWDPNASPKKFSSILGTVGQKVSTCSLNGATYNFINLGQKLIKPSFLKLNGFF